MSAAMRWLLAVSLTVQAYDIPTVYAQKVWNCRAIIQRVIANPLETPNMVS
jgi:hypothetical protein